MLWVEDLETGVLLVPAVTTNAIRTPMSPLIDSVDGDDGNPNDGACLKMTTPCESLFTGNGQVGITVDFSAAPAGLPRFAGLVWTDGEGAVSFEARDGRGMLIGTIGPFSGTGFPDATVQNTNLDIRLANVEGATSILNNDIALLETAAGYGGQFFVSGDSLVDCNVIRSEGDRFLDLDPDPAFSMRSIQGALLSGMRAAKSVLATP